MYAAKLGALDIHWSETILDETTRNLIEQVGFTPEDAEVLVDRLSLYLPKALVEVKKRDETQVAKVEMDAKDRHALADALSAKADVLLTDNTRHFPREWSVSSVVFAEACRSRACTTFTSALLATTMLPLRALSSQFISSSRCSRQTWCDPFLLDLAFVATRDDVGSAVVLFRDSLDQRGAAVEQPNAIVRAVRRRKDACRDEGVHERPTTRLDVAVDAVRVGQEIQSVGDRAKRRPEGIRGTTGIPAQRTCASSNMALRKR